MNRQQSKARLLAFTAAASVVGATPAYAQQDAAEASAPGDIIVTARRYEERLQDVPISITVFNQQQVSDRNIATASDLGTYTPSLTTNSRYGTEKASFAIRGFVQELSTTPSVGVYFAEAVAVRSAGSTTGGSGSGPGSFFDLQNIQVLKGPQGTLFGRNTTGGAILLVPQKPTSRLEGYVEGTLGSLDQRRVEAVVNIPLSDTFRVRLGIDRNKRDGYLRNRTTIGPKDFGDINYTAFRGSVVAELTPNLENYTIATYSNSDTNGSLMRVAGCDRASPSPIAKAGCAQLDRSQRFWDVENDAPSPFTKVQQWQVINTTTLVASDTLTIKNILSYGEYKESYQFDLNGLNLTPLSPNKPQFFVLASNPPGRNNADQNGFTEELQFQGRTANDRLIWQVGGFLEISKPMGRSITQNAIFAVCADHYAFKCDNGNISAADWTISGRSTGLYAQATYKLTEQLSVTGGARYTWDKTEANARNLRYFFFAPNVATPTCQNNLLFPGASLNVGKVVASGNECNVDYKTTSKKPTWLIDIDYKPSSETLLYAKWSRGYRQGYINPNLVVFETWDPEKVDTYEVGAKASFSGAVSGYLNVAAFYNDFTNQQLQVNAPGKPGFSGVNVTVNAGRSEIKGIEVDGSINLLGGLRLDAGYAYLDTKLKSINAPSIPPGAPYLPLVIPTTGDVLPSTPKHRLTLTGSYTLPLDESIGQISFGATYVYTDKQLMTARLLANGQLNPFAVLPSSQLVNLNASWKSVLGQPFDLAAFVTNVTNEKVWLNTATGFASLGVESFLPGPRRMFGVRVKYRFGE